MADETEADRALIRTRDVLVAALLLSRVPLPRQPDGAFARYHKATRPIRTALHCARLLRPVIFARTMTPFFASTFRASKTLKRDYMRLLAGQTEYPQLVARAFLRVPRAAVRFLWRKMRGHKGADILYGGSVALGTAEHIANNMTMSYLKSKAGFKTAFRL